MLRAAVANGADAVYFGLEDFNARRRATNFTLTGLPEVMDYLRGHNVRGYVTLNTLIFPAELAQARQFVEGIAQAGCDAVIVQDLGLARLIHAIAPSLAIHASTQMTQTHAAGLRGLGELGVTRVILARELTLAQIAAIAAQSELEVEVFVHGALCISYSGQCLASETLWGRSANRGQCGQACRLPYRLVADGESLDLSCKYLLSPQDLCALDQIGGLIDAGVTCFKIEGRLKGPHYVAAVVQAYRAAIDAKLAARAAGTAAGPFELTETQRVQLEQTFSRGASDGYLTDDRNPRLVVGDAPDSRGKRIGTVSAVLPKYVLMELEGEAGAEPLKPGDGVVFEGREGDEREQGGRVFTIEPAGIRELLTGKFLVGFDYEAVDLRAIRPGSVVWKTDDPQLRRQLEASYARDVVVRPAAVRMKVIAHVGGPLTLICRDEAGNEVQAQWPGPLMEADKHPLTRDLLMQQLGRLGQTPFELAAVELNTAADSAAVMVPKSVLNDLRRQVAELLIARRREQSRHALAPAAAVEALLAGPSGGPTRQACRMHVLVRDLEQLKVALAWASENTGPATTIYAELADASQTAVAMTLAAGAEMVLALVTPRILKGGDEKLLRTMLEKSPGAILVRNLAGLNLLREWMAGGLATGCQLVGDGSLNCANELTADYLGELGLSRITPSYDLNIEQIKALAAKSCATRLEVVIHQHVPMFHMQHCLLAADMGGPEGLADGQCRKGCRSHAVELEDRNGERHAVSSDETCRTTVYNSFAQAGAQYVGSLQEAGVRHFRVEFLRETAEQAQAILGLYWSLVNRTDEGPAAPAGMRKDVWHELKEIYANRLTRGTWATE